MTKFDILNVFPFFFSLSHFKLGWNPLVQSYIISVPDAVSDRNKNVFAKLLEEHSTLIQDLFSWLVQPCLDFIRLECKLFVTTSPLHLVHSLLNLYTCILDDCLSTVAGDSVPPAQVRMRRQKETFSADGFGLFLFPSSNLFLSSLSQPFFCVYIHLVSLLFFPSTSLLPSIPS